MYLHPRDQDRLILHQAGYLAQKRIARGLRLNTPEATALLASQLQELIRDGNRSVADLMQIGKCILGRRHVMPFVPTLLKQIQVEGTFSDGVFLVTVHNPICTDEGDISLALYGSFFPQPSADLFPILPPSSYDPILAPGAIICKSGPESRITLNVLPGRTRVKLLVVNNGDRPIQVGSHYHFIETNSALVFDRAAAYGRRLDIPSGTAVRFEPGDRRSVTLVDLAGDRVISGGNALASGPVDRERLPEIIRDLEEKGFGNVHDPNVKDVQEPPTMSREQYVEMFGPTMGDRVRLGDTSLWIEVEKDFTVYGDEVKFGGGKTIREGMGQATSVPSSSALDLVITNVLILSPSGIYKADLGIKAGLIAGIGKAGNPATMPSVSPSLIIGAGTDVIAGEHLLLTAGAIDAHVHFICPQQITEALAAGTTTMIGGGTGPSEGTKATTCTPGPRDVENMIRATEGFPMNFLFTGKGNDSGKEALEEVVKAGVGGLKLHEDWGSTPAAIKNCLDVADKYDIQVNIHTDTLNESGFVGTTIAAFGGRTIHTYHTEGAGGGHAPDIIVVCGQENVLPSSTNPTRPFTMNTLDEHLDMLMVCHHLSPNIPEDIAFAESRIRAETIAAEDLLHDLGAISIISSDSQAMGRVAEVVSRTWRTASKMREEKGPLKELGDNEERDNGRVKRYLAKYTVNPAIAHGISHVVGSIAVGQLADLVLWKPENFGAKPETVLKAGVIAWAQMGDPNASIPIVQPTYGRPMFGSCYPASSAVSTLFVSAYSIESGTIASYNLSPHVKRRIEPVRQCRTVTKRDMIYNAYTPVMQVDPETYEVRADGIRCDDISPAKEVALGRKYNLF